MQVDDVARIELGTFVRPPQETGTDGGRVEPVLGYVARTPEGILLLDTGLGEADQETEAWYRPRRVPIEDALGRVGLAVDDVDLVINCHLHFDHIGGNPRFVGRPILSAARAGNRPRLGLHSARAGRLHRCAVRTARWR